MLEEVYVRDFSKVTRDKNITLGWEQQWELLKRSFVQLLFAGGRAKNCICVGIYS